MDDWTKERSREILNKYIESRVKKMFIGVLDYAECAVDSKDRWQALRSRILKLSNDTIRDIKKELEVSYEVNYVTTKEDIIIVNKKSTK